MTGGLIAVGVLVAAGIGLVLLIVFAFGKAADELDKEVGVAATADYDVHITSCTIDDLHFGEATGTLTNTSKVRQSFTVTVRFTRPDNTLVGEDETDVGPLDAGQKGTWSASVLTKAPAGTTCTIGAVNYAN